MLIQSLHACAAQSERRSCKVEGDTFNICWSQGEENSSMAAPSSSSLTFLVVARLSAPGLAWRLSTNAGRVAVDTDTLRKQCSLNTHALS